MRRRLRITYVIPTMRVGGTEKQLFYLMQGLTHDFDISLICTRSEGPFIGEVRRMVSYVRVLDFSSGWDFRVGHRLVNIFRAHPPDILHSFLFGFDLFANRAARKTGVPVIISSRRELATWQKKRHLFMQRRANRYVDCIVANSQAVAEYAQSIEGFDASLCRVIPNGLCMREYETPASSEDLRRRFRLPLDKKIVGMVANFSPVKDHALFIAMAKQLLAKRSDVHFVLVGTGPLVDETLQLAEGLGIAEHFNRFSTFGEVTELHQAIDAFVLTSKMEGFPNAVMEAMASGRAIVAPRVGGIPELIQDGDTGLLIDSRAPEDFAAAVESLLEDPARRERMGAQARTWVVEHLPMQRMVESYRALYHELAARKMAREA